MSYTTDKNDPRLGHGVDEKPIDQHEVYLILSDEERAKGFVRPVRNKYIHVGKEVERDKDGKLFGWLVERGDAGWHKYENEFYTEEKGYGGFLIYPQTYHLTGRYVTLEEIHAIKTGETHFGGCGGETKMGEALAETYARDPKFYGATYCVHCRKHLPVDEFVWSNTNEKVGS